MDLERLRLGRTAWATPEQGASLEWLETNGLGGWAYGTVPNMNTRFYHAVLAAAVHPPTDRLVLLARLEESLVVDGRRYPLYANAWAGGHVEADGLSRLHSFALAPFPTWTYVVGDVMLQKRLFMRHGANTTVVRYQIWTDHRRVTLELTPLVTCRTIHGVEFQNSWPFIQQPGPASIAIEAFPGAPHLHLAADGGALYSPDGAWIKGLHYPYEHLRGEHLYEDLYRPGRFTFTLTGAANLTFVASTDPIHHIDGQAWEEDERARRRSLVAQAGAPADPVMRSLVLAADQFVVQRASIGTSTVIAGYPWFTDWGRDTMIALPGLTLATGRHQLARELLRTFAAYERDGLIPNCFPEQGGEPLYNTADASLWFFEAAWQYLQHTGDETSVRNELYPVLLRIAEAHVRGTHFDIRLMDDGLLRCGNPGVQVTWMDAKVDDWVVTPRDGKPVEIQALWHNALRVLAALSPHQGSQWTQLAETTAQAFDAFWNPAEGCLYDLLHDDGTPDPAIRPNQLFALTLSFPLVTGARARNVVDVAFRELWTPYGLRSLSPRDPAYIGRYAGTRRERDAAYHQGTVWSWLIGPFIRAYLNAYGRTPQTRAHFRSLLEPLIGHLQEFGLGTVAENFDGDPPHTPRACIAQAWSVAELLRILREE